MGSTAFPRRGQLLTWAFLFTGEGNEHVKLGDARERFDEIETYGLVRTSRLFIFASLRCTFSSANDCRTTNISIEQKRHVRDAT